VSGLFAIQEKLDQREAYERLLRRKKSHVFPHRRKIRIQTSLCWFSGYHLESVMRATHKTWLDLVKWTDSIIPLSNMNIQGNTDDW
jgi:hypothetical protein